VLVYITTNINVLCCHSFPYIFNTIHCSNFYLLRCQCAIYKVCWSCKFYSSEFFSKSEYNSLNSISVKFWIGYFSGNGLNNITRYLLRASSFISAECTVMWLFTGTGKIPRIFAPSMAQRQDIKIMRTFFFQNSVAIFYNELPSGTSLRLCKRYS